jgi:cellulose biosynthesis protein BcsQ
MDKNKNIDCLALKGCAAKTKLPEILRTHGNKAIVIDLDRNNSASFIFGGQDNGKTKR